jgi:trehalose 6-phosphate synthase
MVTYQLPLEDDVNAATDLRAWQRRSVGTAVTLGDLVAKEAGAWVGWSGKAGPAPAPAISRGVALEAVGMSTREFELHYEGYCNSTLWPLYHYWVERADFKPEWQDANRTINQRFVDTVVDLAAPGATVWIHDYQLQLVPAMLRNQRLDLRIGFFLHVPFPAPEIFAHLPGRDEVLRGLIGADLVGFQQPLATQNFMQLVRQRLGLQTNGNVVYVEGRPLVVDSFPISVDVDEFERVAGLSRVRQRSKQIRSELGSPRTLLLGIDRLDYTKGIEQRLNAYDRLLADRAISANDAVFVQVGESRTVCRGGHHGGHPAVGRHEPGRQGVRRQSGRQPGRAHPQ